MKLSDSQLNNLKSAATKETGATLKLSSNMIGNSNDETANFPHELLLTDRQDANLCKAFANNSSANIKLSKIQLSKIVQSGIFLCWLLGSLVKTGLLLMKKCLNCWLKAFWYH